MIYSIVKTCKNHGFLNGGIFFHYKDFHGLSKKKIKKNMLISCDVNTTKRGTIAINIKNITNEIIMIQSVLRKKYAVNKIKILIKKQNKVKYLIHKFKKGNMTEEELHFFIEYKYLCNLNDTYNNSDYRAIVTKNVKKLKEIRMNDQREYKRQEKIIKKKIKNEEKIKEEEEIKKLKQERIDKEEEIDDDRWHNKQKRLHKEMINRSGLYKYYDILNIPHDITDKKQIIKYYRDKMKRVHCDKNNTSAYDGGAIENDARDNIFLYYGWN